MGNTIYLYILYLFVDPLPFPHLMTDTIFSFTSFPTNMFKTSSGEVDGTRVFGRQRLHEQEWRVELRRAAVGAGDPRVLSLSRRRGLGHVCLAEVGPTLGPATTMLQLAVRIYNHPFK